MKVNIYRWVGCRGLICINIKHRYSSSSDLLLLLLLIEQSRACQISLIPAPLDPTDWLPHRPDLHSLHRLRGAGLDVALHPLGVRPGQGGHGWVTQSLSQGRLQYVTFSEFWGLQVSLHSKKLPPLWTNPDSENYIMSRIKNQKKIKLLPFLQGSRFFMKKIIIRYLNKATVSSRFDFGGFYRVV